MKSRIVLSGVLLALICVAPALAEQSPPPANQPVREQAMLERAFAKTMSNARLNGFYMIQGQQGPPQQDEYRLGAVEKREGDKWLFHARIEYGKTSLNVPLEIPVLWAGDTAVITVTDLKVPGLGTYTARVMVYGNHYAGTWSSPDHGGYLWGTVEQTPAQTTRPASGELPKK